MHPSSASLSRTLYTARSSLRARTTGPCGSGKSPRPALRHLCCLAVRAQVQVPAFQVGMEQYLAQGKMDGGWRGAC